MYNFPVESPLIIVTELHGDAILVFILPFGESTEHTICCINLILDTYSDAVVCAWIWRLISLLSIKLVQVIFHLYCLGFTRYLCDLCLRAK